MTRPLTPANKTLERSAWTWQDGLLMLAIFYLILVIVQTASQFSSDVTTTQILKLKPR